MLAYRVCVLISRRHEFGLTRVFRFRLTRRAPAAFGNGHKNDEGKKQYQKSFGRDYFVQEVQVDEAVDFFFTFLNFEPPSYARRRKKTLHSIDIYTVCPSRKN